MSQKTKSVNLQFELDFVGLRWRALHYNISVRQPVLHSSQLLDMIVGLPYHRVFATSGPVWWIQDPGSFPFQMPFIASYLEGWRHAKTFYSHTIHSRIVLFFSLLLFVPYNSSIFFLNSSIHPQIIKDLGVGPNLVFFCCSSASRILYIQAGQTEKLIKFWIQTDRQTDRRTDGISILWAFLVLKN